MKYMNVNGPPLNIMMESNINLNELKDKSSGNHNFLQSPSEAMLSAVSSPQNYQKIPQRMKNDLKYTYNTIAES